jgi:uncharacterized membrane protein
VSTMTLWQQAEQLQAEIRAEARKVDATRVAWTLLMLPFVILGFVAAKVVGVAWAVLTFCTLALMVGWRRGRGIPPPST